MRRVFAAAEHGVSDARNCDCEQIVASEYLTAERYSSEATLTLHLQRTAVNHPQPPRFTYSTYSAVVSENSARGTFVANVTVSAFNICDCDFLSLFSVTCLLPSAAAVGF